MRDTRLLLTGMLALSILVAGCDRGKPGNPMPPQKPPMPKTEEEKPKVKPVWTGPAPSTKTHIV